MMLQLRIIAGNNNYNVSHVFGNFACNLEL